MLYNSGVISTNLMWACGFIFWGGGKEGFMTFIDVHDPRAVDQLTYIFLMFDFAQLHKQYRNCTCSNRNLTDQVPVRNQPND